MIQLGAISSAPARETASAPEVVHNTGHFRRARGNAGLISIRSWHSPVVLEPSEESPWSSCLVWAEIFEEAGLPFIILADADLDYTVDSGALRRVPPRGQALDVCQAADASPSSGSPRRPRGSRTPPG